MGHFKEPCICFLTRLLGFAPRSGNVGFEVEIVALGYVFSEYFGFPFQFSFHLTPFISSVIRDWYNGPRQPVLLGVSVPPYSKNKTMYLNLPLLPLTGRHSSIYLYYQEAGHDLRADTMRRLLTTSSDVTSWWYSPLQSHVYLR
jgi:hypothetical protein